MRMMWKEEVLRMRHDLESLTIFVPFDSLTIPEVWGSMISPGHMYSISHE